MSDSKTDWPSDLILEYIELYEKHSVLWDPEHPERKCRDKHFEAWNSIQSELSAKFEVNDLKKKKESLLATYRMLRRKLSASQKNSSDGVGTYQPTWFAYQALDKFLNSSRRLSLDSPTKRVPINSSSLKISSKRQYSSGTDDEKDEEVPIAEPSKVKTPVSAENISYREPQIFGQSVGLQLCEVEKNQRIIAERVISEVLFYARLGNLTQSSTVIVSQLIDEEREEQMLEEG